jgi:hypothetical protein
MATVTYGSALPATASPARKSLWTRFVDAMIESRLRKAEKEIRRYRHLLPDAFERAAHDLGPGSEGQLPFVR